MKIPVLTYILRIQACLVWKRTSKTCSRYKYILQRNPRKAKMNKSLFKVSKNSSFKSSSTNSLQEVSPFKGDILLCMVLKMDSGMRFALNA
jgi:hypothetical protein